MNTDRRKFDLAYNEDFDHFLSNYTADDMNERALRAYILKFAGTQIRRFFFCPGGQRSNFRAASREAIWDGNETAELTPGAKRWVANAKALHDKGIDLYAVWIDAARGIGTSPWLSMRMNDVHLTEHPDAFMHSSFWRDHPHYWRVPGSVHAYADRSLDYNIDAVRDHALAFLTELFDRYDADGIELDWMRFVYHFAPGHEARGARSLLKFWEQVRSLADAAGKRRGRRIELATRVPTRPQVARDLGLDAVDWAHRGFINQITISPFFGTSDFQTPLEQWAELLGDARDRITLAPSLDMRLCAGPGAPPRWIDPDAVRGFASSMFDRGADLVYLFNYHYLHDHRDGRTPPSWVRGFADNLQTVGSPHSLAALPRRHVVTYHDTQSPGTPMTSPLPCEARFNRASQFRIDIGPTPPEGSRIELVAALAERPDMPLVQIEARANSVSCPALPDEGLVTKAPGDASLPGERLFSVSIPQAARVLKFRVDPAVLPRGHNLFELIPRSESVQTQQIVWVELRITPPG